MRCVIPSEVMYKHRGVQVRLCFISICTWQHMDETRTSTDGVDVVRRLVEAGYKSELVNTSREIITAKVKGDRETVDRARNGLEALHQRVMQPSRLPKFSR